MNIELRRFDPTVSEDINLPNEPFRLWGRLHPRYDGQWTYTVETFPKEDVTEMTFPNEHYDGAAMAENSFFVGAYDEDGQCVGLAIYQQAWNKYLYLYDLKVSGRCRHAGVGRALIAEGRKLAAENGYRGLYTQGQDNNLSACLFYLGVGFEIGGLDTKVYTGTKQAGKSDVLFYLDN